MSQPQPTNKVLVHVARVTPRVTYILDFMLGEILGLEYELTINRNEYLASTMPRFAYTNHYIEGELFLGASPILFENGLEKRSHDHNNWKGVKGFFRVDVKSIVPFDLFGTAFYLLTRYDEYLIYHRDKHGRVRARETSPVRFKFAEKPVVDMYAYELKRVLKERYPQLQFKERKFSYTCTIDVDMAFSFKGKQWWRSLGGFLKALFVTDTKQLRQRSNVLRGAQQDPYDTFDYITDTQKQYGFDLKFFWLLGNYSKYDKNIPHTNPDMRGIIKRIAAAGYESHLHISYNASRTKQQIQEEQKRLQEITGISGHSSRFHYLRFTLPSSYQLLASMGFTNEYSMGVAAHQGFRAGTCTPFLFFDLEENKVTGLRVHPFAVMDATLRHYQKMKPTSATEKICEMMDSVKSVDGNFCCIWHNNSFCEDKVWKGWRHVFEQTSDYAHRLMHK